MNSPLADFLATGAKTPFVWGSEDCCLFACDWVLSQRAVDPARRYRGSYRTERGAYRVIRRAGGFLAMVEAEMAAAGLMETSDPLPGDVGVVETEQREALAICSRVGWVAKAPRGIVAASFKLIKAWTV